MASAVASSASSNQPPQIASSANESFLECHRPRVIKALDDHSGIKIRDLAKIVADYAVSGDVFGSKEYEKYFGVQTEQIEIDDEFYKFWSAPDALEPDKLNCDTHFPPILVPQTVTKSVPAAYRHRFARDVDRIDFSLETLGKLVEKPLEGNPLRLSGPEALIQNKKTKAEAAYFVVARKEVFARGLSSVVHAEYIRKLEEINSSDYKGPPLDDLVFARNLSVVDEQKKYMRELNETKGSGYEELPSALDLATVSFVHHLVTGERYLGDSTGMEGRETISRSQDTVKYNERRDPIPVVVGFHTPNPYGGLTVFHDSYDVDLVALAGLRKFPKLRHISS